MLPVKIPLKVYVDIGTYADAWKANAVGSRVLYDAGLQLSIPEKYDQRYMFRCYTVKCIRIILNQRLQKNVS